MHRLALLYAVAATSAWQPIRPKTITRTKQYVTVPWLPAPKARRRREGTLASAMTKTAKRIFLPTTIISAVAYVAFAPPSCFRRGQPGDGDHPQPRRGRCAGPERRLPCMTGRGDGVQRWPAATHGCCCKCSLCFAVLSLSIQPLSLRVLQTSHGALRWLSLAQPAHARTCRAGEQAAILHAGPQPDEPVRTVAMPTRRRQPSNAPSNSLLVASLTPSSKSH